LTGRIDFVDPHSNGDLLLQVEETQIVNSPGGVEHREIRRRRATLGEGKIVLVSYHTQRNLLMSANFIVNASRETASVNNDQSDSVGQSILSLLHTAADETETDSRRSLETAQRLSHQLHAAQDRIAELEAEVRPLSGKG
jgi:hypothetical protein